MRVRLPLAEDPGDGLRPDQTEQVILNGRVWNLARGVVIDVPPEVFLALKERYPEI